MKKKVLLISSVSSMIDNFNMPNVKLLIDMGYQVDIACNFIKGNTTSTQRVKQFQAELKELGVICYQIDFERKIGKIHKHILALKQIEHLLGDKKGSAKYQFIHCHTPIGGVVGRIAAHNYGIKVIYTAHGFHFYNGSSIKNWLLYYPIEKFLARWTTVLITINKEDYCTAKQSLHAGKIVYLPGIGIDTSNYRQSIDNREQERLQFGLEKGQIMLFSVGELSKRKNHEIIIKALAGLDKRYCFYVCGQGDLRNQLMEVAKQYHVEHRVKLLGYRADISYLCKLADVFVFPSLQEGLPVALMEAMASGLPCVVSDIRGNNELIQNNKGGFLIKTNNASGYIDGIKKVKPEMGVYNQRKVEKYGIKNVIKKMESIYGVF